MADPENVLRQRTCRLVSCRSLFYICRRCDRGQGYCSPACRAVSRRQQCRDANRRHQQSPEGRADHRDRQRAYRKRLQAARVTDQGRRTRRTSIKLSRPRADFSLARKSERLGLEIGHVKPFSSGSDRFRPTCIVCGRAGGWVDPFP